MRSTCPTCGKHEAQPSRRRVGGKIVEGCVDGFHSDAMLHSDTPDGAWHWRPEAIRFRAESVDHARISRPVEVTP